MKNKELLNQYTLLKQQICDYIAQMLGDKKLHLEYTFQSIDVSAEDTYSLDPYCVSQIFVSDGDVYIEISDEQYPEETEETSLVDESMDVVFHLCELVENKIIAEQQYSSKS